MKILAVGMNYAAHTLELHANENIHNTEPVLFMKPDSAVIQSGKPFFLPSHLGRIDYETEMVVRICRLGKNIAPQFAHRYYDAVTVGIDFTAREMQAAARAKANPWLISKGFDGSAVLGEFVPVQEIGDIQNLPFHLDIDGCTVQKGHTHDMLFTVDQIIAYVSQYMTLKIGDLLFTGTPVGVGPVSIDQHLEGYLADRKLLDFYIR